MKEIKVKEFEIAIEFPYSPGMKNRVKQLPDVHFDWDDRLWKMPVSAMHANLAIQFGREHKFRIDREVLDLVGSPKKKRSEIREKLRPFQKEGLDFLNRSSGRAILADDMGLGKTIQTIAWIYESNFTKFMIVCPASVVDMWQEQLKIWGNIDAVVIRGFTKPFEESNVYIMSYAVFTNRIYTFNQMEFELVVFDECHYLSNAKTKRFKAAKTLKTPHFLGLSGTPFLNRPKELWALLNLVNPTSWPSFFKYAKRFCDAKQGYFGWDFDGASNLPQLKELTDHLLLRRTKAEVLHDLPAIQRTYLPYLTEKKSLLKSYQEAFEADLLKPAGSNSVRFMESRKIIGMMKVDPSLELAKSLLDNDRKVVLFAFHKDVVRALENGLKDYGVIKIVGDTPQKRRHEYVSQFQYDEDTRVAIISPAGGEGINLFASNALIFVEREWNPGKEAQIEGRVHRMGQTENVDIYYVIAKNTIDEKIHLLINQKRDVVNQILTFDDIPTTDLLSVGNNGH